MLDPLTAHLFRHSGQQGAIVLMYHSTEPGAGCARWPWSISLAQFQSHLDLLREQDWTTRTVAELAQTAPRDLPPRTVAITFDDGFKNNLDAAQALIDRGMRATWFVVTGAIGRAPHWPADGRPAGTMLDAADLRDLQAAGMEIGSHSVNHCRLTTVPAALLRSELTESKQVLEDILAVPVQSFAYPYGDWNEACEAEVERAGYCFACTTRSGAALKDAHPLRLRRLTVYNHDSAGAFARKLSLVGNHGAWSTVASYYYRRAANRLRRQRIA